MKFSEMLYQRPDLEVIKSQIMELTDKLISATDYPAAKAVFMEKIFQTDTSTRQMYSHPSDIRLTHAMPSMMKK